MNPQLRRAQKGRMAQEGTNQGMLVSAYGNTVLQKKGGRSESSSHARAACAWQRGLLPVVEGGQKVRSAAPSEKGV